MGFLAKVQGNLSKGRKTLNTNHREVKKKALHFITIRSLGRKEKRGGYNTPSFGRGRFYQLTLLINNTGCPHLRFSGELPGVLSEWVQLNWSQVPPNEHYLYSRVNFIGTKEVCWGGSNIFFFVTATHISRFIHGLVSNLACWKIGPILGVGQLILIQTKTCKLFSMLRRS